MDATAIRGAGDNGARRPPTTFALSTMLPKRHAIRFYAPTSFTQRFPAGVYAPEAREQQRFEPRYEYAVMSVVRRRGTLPPAIHAAAMLTSAFRSQNTAADAHVTTGEFQRA